MDSLLTGYARARAESLACAAQEVKAGGWAHAAPTVPPEVSRDFYNARVLALAVEELARLVVELTAPEVVARDAPCQGLTVNELIARGIMEETQRSARMKTPYSSPDLPPKPTLRIKERYRTRDGRIATLFKRDGADTLHECFSGRVEGESQNISWHPDGRLWMGRAWVNPLDLVSDVPLDA